MICYQGVGEGRGGLQTRCGEQARKNSLVDELERGVGGVLQVMREKEIKGMFGGEAYEKGVCANLLQRDSERDVLRAQKEVLLIESMSV